MTNPEILTTLHNVGTVTIGDLDAWREPLKLSRWAALNQLAGERVADNLLARLAVNAARRSARQGCKLRAPRVDVIPNPEIK